MSDLPNPWTPADVVVGWSCYEDRASAGGLVIDTTKERREGYIAVARLHRPPCRLCAVDLPILAAWLARARRPSDQADSPPHPRRPTR